MKALGVQVPRQAEDLHYTPVLKKGLTSGRVLTLIDSRMDQLQKILERNIDELDHFATQTTGTCASIGGCFAIFLAPPPISVPIVFAAFGGVKLSKKYAKHYAVREFGQDYGDEVSKYRHLQENLKNSPDIVLGKNQLENLVKHLGSKNATSVLYPLLREMNGKQRATINRVLPKKPDPEEIQAKAAAELKMLLLQQQVMKAKLIAHSLNG